MVIVATECAENVDIVRKVNVSILEGRYTPSYIFVSFADVTAKLC